VAALSHPGILTIHDVGEEAGQFFLVTELLDGGTLRQRLAGGALPWRQALASATTVASALAGAHARGVVHRDLKPENIFCTIDGAVKILDFGVAKFVAPPDARTTVGPAASELTQTGAAVGTVAYMAPEQLEGRAVDHRADQFSFGVVLYETLAGARPFHGATTHETVAAILRDEPPSLDGVRPDVPASLSGIVSRCLAKDPLRRYASTADLALALEDIRSNLGAGTTGVEHEVSAQPRRTVWRLVASLGLAALLAAAVAGVRRGTPLTPSDASAPAGEQAVAVLPFDTIGDGQEYLADGITEAVTRELGRVELTRVIASNSAFAYRGRTEGFGEVGRALGVGLLVRGSVQRAGGRVRISVSLVETAQDTTLWSDRYDRDATAVLAVQDEIAWQIAAQLASRFRRAAPTRPSPSSSTTPEAYDAYLRGLWYATGRSGVVDAGKSSAAAVEEFERAVALDANFALARARLASAYTQRFFYDAGDPAFEQKAFLEIEKALAINPDQAEAHLARAQLIWNLRNGFQHEQAIADLRRAVASNPNLAEAHVELGKVYYHIGLLDKAIASNEEALRLDPMAALAARRKVLALIDGRRVDQLREEITRTNPRWLSSSIRAAALLVLGDPEAARRALGDLRPDAGSGSGFADMRLDDVAAHGHVYARLKRHADAERVLMAVIPRAVNPTGLSDTHHAQFSIGCTLTLLGRPDEAVRWLTKAADEGYPSYPKFSTEPDLVSLKGHAGFVALLERLRHDFERWQVTL